MSLNTFLTDLEAARSRFAGLLAGKGITLASGATIIDCLDALADYWNVAPSSGQIDANRTPTTNLVLTAPEDLYLYYGGQNDSNLASHYWDDPDVLTLKVLRGNSVLTTSCTGYNGVGFEFDSLSHLCAGYRVLCDVGEKPSGVESAELTIQWLHGSTVVKAQTRTFDWKHTPQYFSRPAGEGNYSLKIGGSAVAAEVYSGGQWIDFPNGVLTAQYAGHAVRTKVQQPFDAIACWSNEGADGDPFWYLV